MPLYVDIPSYPRSNLTVAGQIHAPYNHRSLQHLHLLESRQQLHRHAITTLLRLHDLHHRSSSSPTTPAPIPTFPQPVPIPRSQLEDLLVARLRNQHHPPRTPLLHSRRLHLLQLLVRHLPPSNTHLFTSLSSNPPPTGTGARPSPAPPSAQATPGSCSASSSYSTSASANSSPP